MENGGFEFIIKTAAGPMLLILGRKISTAATAVFFIYRRAVSFVFYLSHFGPTWPEVMSLEKMIFHPK